MKTFKFIFLVTLALCLFSATPSIAITRNSNMSSQQTNETIVTGYYYSGGINTVTLKVTYGNYNTFTKKYGSVKITGIKRYDNNNRAYWDDVNITAYARSNNSYWEVRTSDAAINQMAAQLRLIYYGTIGGVQVNFNI